MRPDPSTITVAAQRPYDVLIGQDLGDLLPDVLGGGVRRVGIVHSKSVEMATLNVARVLRRAGYEVHDLTVPEGEPAKHVSILAGCWSRLGLAGFTRSDAIVAVGGGAVTDLAGFVAATFLRGIAVVHLPTTLLAMVDAAVGGKTGINTAEGKNLVGAFHEPAGVICDLDTLRTLPEPEMVSGLAEVIKCGFIRDTAILDLVAADPQALMPPDSPALVEAVTRAVHVKADVVAGDLLESTSHGSDVGREALNYGHTFGHAIELNDHFTRRHGEAVSIGMVFAAELARAVGAVEAGVVDQHRRLLSSVGLPTTYPDGSWEALLAAMRLDKKTRGDTLRFVVLDGGPGKVTMLEGPSDSALHQARAAVTG